MVSTSNSFPDTILKAVNSSTLAKPKPKPSSMFLSHSCVVVASLSLPRINFLSCSSNDPRNLIPCPNLPRYAEIWKDIDVAAICIDESPRKSSTVNDGENWRWSLGGVTALSSAAISLLASSEVAFAGTDFKIDPVYEVGELFELGIQLSYLLLLLALLGVGTFFVIRQVLVRRELDLSAKELQEQVRSGDASATELFELGAVMLRRKFYPAATKYLLQAIEKWDGDDLDLAQVYNALGVSYVRDGKLEKGIAQFEKAVKLQPGYVTAWNNLGDAYEKKKDLKSALKAFEEVLLFDPNNKVARPRFESLRDRVNMYKGVPVKSKER